MSTHIVKLNNLETNRYAFCPAPKNEQEGSEGGWIGPKTQDHPLLGADANYYNRAMWEVENRGTDVVALRNHESRRLIFDQGPKFEGKPGDEGGWDGPNTKKALSADANYYNRALWKVIPQGNGSVFLQNVETHRLLFDTSDKFTGNRGAEGGWIASNIKQLVTVDANYYNRAMWLVEGEPLIKPQQPAQPQPVSKPPLSPAQLTTKVFFDKEVTVLVSDMSGFTRLTKKRGIIHFTSLMLTMRSLAMPIMRNNGALLLATEADNLIVVFENITQAVQAAVQTKRVVDDFNAKILPSPDRDDWKIIFGGLGISTGKGVLVTSELKPFGVVFDEAFNLGENIAQGGNIILSQTSFESLKAHNADFSSFGKYEETTGYEGGKAFHFTPADGFGHVSNTYNKDYSEFIPKVAQVFLDRHTLVNQADIDAADANIRKSFNRELTCVMWGLEYGHINKSHGPELALQIREKINHILTKATNDNKGTVEGILFFFSNEKDALKATLQAKAEILRFFNEEKDATKRPVFKGAGMHSGDILYVKETDIQFGDPINTASKLGEDYAEGGAICTSTSIYDLIHNEFPENSFAAEEAKFEGGLSIKCFSVTEKKQTSVQLLKHPSKYIVKGNFTNDIVCHSHPRCYVEIEPIATETNGLSDGVVIEGSNGQLQWVYGINHFSWGGNRLYIFVRDTAAEFHISQVEELNRKFPPGTSLTFYKNVPNGFDSDQNGIKL